MATFIVLCNFEQNVDVSEMMCMEDRAKRLLSETGGRLEQLWLTTGAFDMVVVADAADVSRALTFLMAFSSLGRVRTMTLAAAPQADDLIAAADDAKTNVGEGGG